jgi:hypothetical protein
MVLFGMQKGAFSPCVPACFRQCKSQLPTQLVPIGMQNRTFSPYVAAMHRILMPVLPRKRELPLLEDIGAVVRSKPWSPGAQQLK